MHVPRTAVFAMVLAALRPPADSAVRPQSRTVTILASAETHAMLQPCDCPDAPGGGLAQRATVVSSLRDSGAVALVDAGGFAAGGIYDTYSEGRGRDSLRTLAALQAMGLMGYDAVLVGDDDLQYGAWWLADAAERYGVPLITANCRVPGPQQVFAAYRVVERGGLRIGITGVTTAERLFEVDPSVTVLDPDSSLRSLWDTLQRLSDVQVVLSHLGEEQTVALASRLPGVDLVVNGHRKRGASPLAISAPVPVLSFGFQGKALSRIRLYDSAGVVRAGDAAWVPVGPEVAARADVESAVRTVAAGQGAAPYDLYIMSRCPHGLAALREFLDFAARFSSVEWHLWFIGDIESSGRLVSLAGPEEVADEQLWLAVRDLYPGRWAEFLRARALGAGATPAIAAGLGMDTTRLHEWARTRGEQALAMHYRRSMRLGVDASPTLMRANAPAPFDVTQERLAWEECRHVRSTAPFCDSLPGCLDNSDCRSPGRLGECVGEGRSRACRFREDVRFTFTVVSADSLPDPDERSAIATTRELFPAAHIVRVQYGSRKGRRLLAEIAPDALPLYLFERTVERAANFARVKDGLERTTGGYYTFRPGVMPRSFFPGRPRVAGALTVFLDPVARFAPEVIRTALDAGPAVRVLPMVYPEPADHSPDPEERFRNEEAQRWLLLDSLYPAALAPYLAGYAQRPGSSNWLLNLPPDVDPGTLAGMLSADTALLARHRALLQELDIRSPVAVLVENQRLVRVGDATRLAAVLGSRSRVVRR